VALVNVFQYTIAVFIASVILAVTSAPSNDQSVFGSIFKQLTTGDILVGCFQFGSMNSSTVALKYVSFPFVVLAKSAKVIPVIMMGALRGVYKPTTKQYFIAVFISLGLFIFNFYKPSKKSSSQSADMFGMLLLLGSLIFDGLTGTQTDK